MRPTLSRRISPLSVDKMTRRSPQRKHRPPPLPPPLPAVHRPPSVAAGVKGADVDAATPREVDAEAHPRARPGMR